MLFPKKVKHRKWQTQRKSEKRLSVPNARHYGRLRFFRAQGALGRARHEQSDRIGAQGAHARDREDRQALDSNLPGPSGDPEAGRSGHGKR